MLDKKIKLNKINILYNIIGLSFFEFLFIIIFIPIYFSTNDDIAMNAIASGAITGSPSEYLIFTNIIIGKTLKLFFTYLPKLNWYTWYLLICAFMGYTSIQYSISKLKGEFWLKVLRHLLVLILLFEGIFNFQFTKIAAITLLGGFVLVFTSKAGEIKEIITGIGLIILGSLIRFEVFLMYLILSIPFLSLYIFKKQYDKVLAVSAATFVILMSVWFNSYYYDNNQEFKAYDSYNKLRSRITIADNPTMSIENKQGIIKEIGWTYNDFLLATNFNLDIGHPKFTQKKLSKLLDESISISKKTFSLEFFYQLKYSFNDITNYLYSKSFIIFYVLLFLMLLNNWRDFISLSLFILFILFVTFIIHYYFDGRLKPRVFYGIIIPFYLLQIYNLRFEKLLNKLKFINSKFLKIILLMMTFYFVSIPLMDRFNHRSEIYDRFEVNKKMDQLILNQNDRFYVNWVYLSTVYNIFDLPPMQVNAYFLGWFANSPFNKEKIERYTGNRDLGVYSIYNKEIVWYYRNDLFYKNFGPLVKKFYLSNFKKCTYNREIARIDEKNLVVKETYFITKP